MRKKQNIIPWAVGLTVLLLAYTAYLPFHFGLSQSFSASDIPGTAPSETTQEAGGTTRVTETLPQESSEIRIDEDGVMLQSKEVVSPRQKEAENVHINQVGYYTKGTKRAIVIGGGVSFELIRLNEDGTGVPVYRGMVENTGKGKDVLSGERCYIADFTEYTKPGTYYLCINPGMESEVTSYSFTIGDHVLDDVCEALVKMLYYQRCGMALEAEYAGVYTHGVCHTSPTTYQTRNSMDVSPVYLDVTGGWHEAGDFSKTVASGAAAVGCLLMAYDWFPSAFDDATNIPESGNGIPDVLDEARYEVDWFLKMQMENGGMCPTAFPWDHPRMIMPDQDTELVYLVYPEAVSTTALGVACFEKMARLIQPFDPDYAETCHAAALRGWEYIRLHLDEEETLYEQYPAQKSGAKPSMKNSSVVRLWAAVESFLYTGNPIYEDMVYDLRSHAGDEYLKWSFGGFATAAYALSNKTEKNPELQKLFSDKLLRAGRNVYEAYLTTGYELPLMTVTMNTDFYICQNAINLIASQILNPDLDYHAAIEGCMNYLLGCNPLDVSFISGFGTNFVNNIHHRQSYADGIRQAIPGYMVVGSARYEWVSSRLSGLDSYMDGSTPGLYGYVDNMDFFMMTEVEVDSNSMAVFVSSYLEAAQGSAS